MSATTLPHTDRIWEWLSQVPDPEIPVISLTDLGIIRDVQWQGDTLVVTVTPTYSGCPATSIINLDIETALRSHGIEKLELKRQLAPAWTTDWITAEGREKLRAYGIAPPAPKATRRALFGLDEEVACPRCGSADTERLAEFGSTACKALWRCRACREPFDHFKCH